MAASSLYQRRVLQGLCGRCGQGPPEPGRRGCRACLDRCNNTMKARERKEVEAGLCPTCKRPGFAPRARRPRQRLLLTG